MTTETDRRTIWQIVRQSHAIHPDWSAEIHLAYLQQERSDAELAHLYELDGSPRTPETPLRTILRWLDEMAELPPLVPANDEAPDPEPEFSHDGEGAFYGGSRRPNPLEATDRCPQCGTDFRGKYCEACALVDTAVDLVHELIGDDDDASDRLDALASLLATVSAKPELAERIALDSGMMAP